MPSRYRAGIKNTLFGSATRKRKEGKWPNLVEFLGILQCKLLVLFEGDS